MPRMILRSSHTVEMLRIIPRLFTKNEAAPCNIPILALKKVPLQNASIAAATAEVVFKIFLLEYLLLFLISILRN